MELLLTVFSSCLLPIYTVGNDFNASTITHSLDATSNSQGCLTVALINDNFAESSETFTVQLSTSESGVSLFPSSAVVSITDIGR